MLEYVRWSKRVSRFWRLFSHFSVHYNGISFLSNEYKWNRVLHKSMIVASEPHKTPNFRYKARMNSILNYLNLLRIYDHLFFWNFMTQKCNRCQQKLTLRKFSIQPLFPKITQNNTKMVDMFFLTFRIDQNIISNDYDERTQEMDSTPNSLNS